MPITPFMGVRTSWLMLARKALFARSAVSAASLARCRSASTWARRRDLLLEGGVGRLEVGGAHAHPALHLLGVGARLAEQVPLLGKGVRELQHLDRVEGLLEDDQPVGAADLGEHLLPGVVRIGGADHDLQVGRHLPEFQGGLDRRPSPGGMRTSTKAMA